MIAPLEVCRVLIVHLSMPTATFAVQDISISVVSNELTVQCQFAEGSTHDMCTVVLLLNGEKYRMENSTGEITFSELSNGTYTVLVYDSEPEMMGGSGDLEVPAIERTVTISGGTTSPSPSVDMPRATGEHLTTVCGFHIISG